MKQIKNKTNGITIQGTGLNNNSNTIDYSINIPLLDIEYAVAKFPFINGQTQLIDGNFTYGSNKHIPNLPDIMSSNFIVESDLGLSGTEIIKNFSTSILFDTNAFELNLDEWEITQNSI